MLVAVGPPAKINGGELGWLIGKLFLLDAWIAIDQSVNAGKAEHIVLGYEKYISDYKFQIEGYYKNIYNMLTFEDKRASTDGQVSSEQLSDILTPSDGEAGGIEFFVQKFYFFWTT